ncbi:hypothetical protein ACHAXA_008228 [Cyclostephanos tholiformis]|uniref:monogalactosyldiacylglycerol synthase n=1 Tax=Cyclostephanos tholiformis TaxID=382380 RepID=A0ABD3R273_9STRA
MRVEKSSAAIWLLSLASSARAFQPPSPSIIRRHHHHHHGAEGPFGEVVSPSKAAFTVTPLFSALRAAPPTDDDAATIQILMSDTGGGHRASANALRDAFNVLHETDPMRFPLPIKCDIVDIYTDYGPFPFNMYVQAYKIMAEYTFLWKWFYETGATPFGLWLYDVVLELICFGPFKECMTRVDPNNVVSSPGGGGKRADMVVSVHPLCQDLPLKILTSLDTDGASRKVGRTTPFVTVVTDLGGAHPSWFNRGVDRCFVPSDVLKNAALDRNVDESKIVQYGLPIRRGFWRFGSEFDMSGSDGKEEKNERAKMNKPAMRERLGLSNLPTVLIVGGGDGMGGIVSQAKAVGERLQKLATSSSTSYQMVVVCGNNKAAQSSLSPPQMQWGADINVHVHGFVNNMDEFMRASDILVTKAGPGTIAEASICGLPCILSSFLPGQEEGNVPYVVDNGFGCYQGSPEGIADTVEEWFASTRAEGSMLERMQECALIAARPDATLDIAKDLAEMLYARREELKKAKKVSAAIAVAA